MATPTNQSLHASASAQLQPGDTPWLDHYRFGMVLSIHSREIGRYPLKPMKLTILPPGPVYESGLYPRAMAFKGLRTGSLTGKQSRKRNKRRKNCDNKLNTKAGQQALARQKAKEERGRLIVLSIEKAAGITRKPVA